MPTLHSHTHCQATQANAKTQALQRVCLPHRTDDRKESTIAQQWLYVMRVLVLN